MVANFREKSRIQILKIPFVVLAN